MVDLTGIDWSSVVQAILFAFFATFTAIVNAVIGPTYDYLFVPLMQPSAAYPPLSAAGGSGDFLSAAARFSTYLVANVVDPLLALVALGVGLLYLVRSFVVRWGDRLDHLLPRLVVSVVVANFTLPIAGGLLGVAGALYPVLAGWDGGAWEHWVDLTGYGQFVFSWDNGALAFVLSFVEFLLVFGLLLALGVRDALLAVLIVLLPVFTLLWPLGPLSGIARRAWLLFFEVAFLPCVLVVPLELAVGATSPVLLVGYLAAALATPYLLSVAGTHLAAFGFPGSGAAVSVGGQRGLGVGPSTAGSVAGPSARAAAGAGPLGRAAAGTAATAGSASFPAAAPLAAAELIGHGALHLLRHLPSSASGGSQPRWAPVRGGGPR